MVRIIPAVFLLSLVVQAHATVTPYPSMAPLDQYLIADRNAEIALAKSAAPTSVANDAEVMVLERQGYKTAVKGTNGFVCIVERSWTAGFGDPEFWNPKIRAPICFNPPTCELPPHHHRENPAVAGTLSANGVPLQSFSALFPVRTASRPIGRSGSPRQKDENQQAHESCGNHHNYGAPNHRILPRVGP